jgi:MOSC domain-containing protein YiiM
VQRQKAVLIEIDAELGNLVAVQFTVADQTAFIVPDDLQAALKRDKVDLTQPNLRQIHLIHSELLSELRSKGFSVDAGAMGENVLTQGIDLLSLPKNTLPKLGGTVVLRVTGLRNPCGQLDNFQKGLTKAVLAKDSEGNVIIKAGVMAVVEIGGTVILGDLIEVQMPNKPYEAPQRV